jgi:predicted metalloprotease with PDZ domain
MHEPCTVELGITDEYKIACGMPIEGKTLLAQDYYQLVDSPVLASPYLQCQTYKATGYSILCLVFGKLSAKLGENFSDFARFSEKQIDIMGDFPEKDYHFINWILPVAFYHGVEHRNSTMIVLGSQIPREMVYIQIY